LPGIRIDLLLQQPFDRAAILTTDRIDQVGRSRPGSHGDRRPQDGHENACRCRSRHRYLVDT